MCLENFYMYGMFCICFENTLHTSAAGMYNCHNIEIAGNIDNQACSQKFLLKGSFRRNVDLMQSPTAAKEQSAYMVCA